MTTLTLHMSRCLGRRLQRGDEIVLSRMDHDANVAPWLLLADDLGLTVRWMDFDPETYEFPEDALTRVLSDEDQARGARLCIELHRHDQRREAFCGAGAGGGRARLCRCGAVRTALRHRCRRILGCDVLVSSAYKFFGPHQGILWGREELLDRDLRLQGAGRPATTCRIDSRPARSAMKAWRARSAPSNISQAAATARRQGLCPRMSERAAAIHRAFDRLRASGSIISAAD